MKLQATHCNKCKKDYLVSIDGKDIRKSKTSGGENYFAIGGDEITKAEKLINKEIPCKHCGNMCKVDTVKMVSRAQREGKKEDLSLGNPLMTQSSAEAGNKQRRTIVRADTQPPLGKIKNDGR